jgi:Flp pilus assembly protein TadB
MKRSKEKPEGKIIWISWSMAMLLLLYFCVDRVFGYNVLSFEIFVFVVLFFILLLLLIILGWVLRLRNRQNETHERLTNAIKKLETSLTGN